MSEDDILLCWFHHYVKNDGEGYDKHTQFAEDIGKSRADAKEMCYKLAHKVSESMIIKIYFE